MGLSKEQVKTLTHTFADDKLGVKVQSVNRDKNRAMLVLYLQHTDVMDRLDEVDPNWSSSVLAENKEVTKGYDNKEHVTHYVRMSLTLGGVVRENVGEGNDPKAAYSDALKRCAMLFGVGRYLYDSTLVWVPYNEDTDKYKQWTIEEYNKFLKNQKSNEKPKTTVVAEQTPTHGSLTVQETGMATTTYVFPEDKWAGRLKSRPINNLTNDEMKNFLDYWGSRQPLKGSLKEAFETVAKVYNTRLSSPPVSTMMTEDDIPF